MSDDTPTQRLPETGGTPTERIPAGAQEDLVEEKQKSRGLLIGLIAAGALLIVAVIVLIWFVLSGAGAPLANPTNTPLPTASGQQTPSASPTPTATETEDPEPPQQTGPAFTSLDPVEEVECVHGGPFSTPDPPLIKVSWATTRTVSAWIVQGTSDAADSGFMQLTNNGDESDFAYPLQFPCFQASTQFTITLVGDDGSHLSQSWTVTNVGERD
jgi:cytoskeletal protein RodZ